MKTLGRRALLVALLLNGAFFFVEAGVGVATGSLVLLSDAVHMFTDVIALSVAFAAATVRMKPRSDTATFGHGRVAVLGGLVNGLLSVGAAVVIVVEAVHRLQAPPLIPGFPVLVTAAVGLGVNLVAAWWLHRSGDRGVNMRGALVHMLGDALGSVAAIAAGVVLLMGGPLLVDAAASIVVAVVVAGSALPLLRDVVQILLERAPRGLDLAKVRDRLRARPEIKDVVGLHAWALDDGETMASFVLTTDVNDLQRLVVVADEVREELEHALGIVHATIEWRPLDAARACCDDAAGTQEEHKHDPDRHQSAA
ncbi:MAG: cation diffusion facilitator family transporter [Deltaproteobacteria bacterium]|nr:cation diffusion facilitator family transporter [Deltaproteobacteria bacterium]